MEQSKQRDSIEDLGAIPCGTYLELQNRLSEASRCTNRLWELTTSHVKGFIPIRVDGGEPGRIGLDSPPLIIPSACYLIAPHPINALAEAGRNFLTAENYPGARAHRLEQIAAAANFCSLFLPFSSPINCTRAHFIVGELGRAKSRFPSPGDKRFPSSPSSLPLSCAQEHSTLLTPIMEAREGGIFLSPRIDASYRRSLHLWGRDFRRCFLGASFWEGGSCASWYEL